MDSLSRSPETGRVQVMSRAELAGCVRWTQSFSGERKDLRYYALLEDTLSDGFEYRYFAVVEPSGAIGAIQPFFLIEQDLFVGAGPRVTALVSKVRRLWPRFLKLRTLMVGCVTGEAQLDARCDETARSLSRLLSEHITGHAIRQGASLIVLKEFPARYRDPLEEFVERGFKRIPSMPMTRLNIDYASFDEYMTKALNSATRKKLRKKFQATASALPIELSIVSDVKPYIDEVYPLYLQVYNRSKLHFEKLTRDYFCELGRTAGDRAKFFLWRQGGSIVAFCACLTQGDSFYAEYVGFDYRIALDQHLYHYAVRDMITWAIGKKFKWFRSSGLNYDPKLHLRHQLDPVDLYVKHISPIGNAIMHQLLPWIEPVRQDKTLPKFANYSDLWVEPRKRPPAAAEISPEEQVAPTFASG